MQIKLYRGNGCRVHNDCFTCPLAVCIYDAPVIRHQSSVRELNAVKVRALRAEGKLVSEIAEIMQVSRRTVFRHLLR